MKTKTKPRDSGPSNKGQVKAKLDAVIHDALLSKLARSHLIQFGLLSCISRHGRWNAIRISAAAAACRRATADGPRQIARNWRSDARKPPTGCSPCASRMFGVPCRRHTSTVDRRAGQKRLRHDALTDSAGVQAWPQQTACCNKTMPFSRVICSCG